MYQRQIARAPEVITRDAFIIEIFELGRVFEYGYDTIVGAVELADRFMLITEPRWSYYDHIKFEDQVRIHESYKNKSALLILPIEQCYSKELVVAALILAGKSNEDDSHNINYGLLFCENYYIIKMEWDLASCFDYHIRVNNFITDIGLMLTINRLDTLNQENGNLAPVFAELAQDICRIPQWWTISSTTIIMASLYLYQRNKLKARIVDKIKRFHNFITAMADETESSIETVLDTYINIKQS